MKRILLVVLISTSSIHLNAQLSIAPEIGVNFAKTTYDAVGFTSDFDLKRRIGFRAGALVHLPVYKGFYVEPGLFFSMKGFREDFVETVSGVPVAYKASFNINYLEIPLNLGFRCRLGKAGALFASAGPYLSYALGGNRTAKITVMGNMVEELNDDMPFGDGVYDVEPVDIGFNFSIGYKSPIGLYIRGQYGLGLGNLSNDSYFSVKNRVMSVSMGYAFKL